MPQAVPAIGQLIISGGRENVHVTVGIAKGSGLNLMPEVVAVSREQAAGVVGQAAPTIVGAAKAQTMKGIARGDADKIMAGRYGSRLQASRKT